MPESNQRGHANRMALRKPNGAGARGISGRRPGCGRHFQHHSVGIGSRGRFLPGDAPSPAERHSQQPTNTWRPDVFGARIRGIFDTVVRGEWDFLRAVILPRTSEQEYKLFLYLREVAREYARDGMPPVYLYDLLHSRSPESHAYGLSRTEDLKRQLEEIAGRPIATTDIFEAVAESNAARAAVRRLLRLRHGAPRLTGSEALPLIGAYWFMARAQYAKLATGCCRNL